MNFALCTLKMRVSSIQCFHALKVIYQAFLMSAHDKLLWYRTHLKKLFPKRMDDHLFISYTFLQQKKKNFLSVRDKFFSHIKCVSFSLSTSAKYICLDTLRHYALLLNSSHEPFAIYMNPNNRKKCLRWKWNCILNYHDHNDGEII